MSRGGFADVHNHQFAHLGFGGLAFHGEPTGKLEDALPWCDFVRSFPPSSLPRMIHGPGGVNDLAGRIFQYVYRPVGQALPQAGHLVGGYPQFDGWPRWDSITHQSVHEDWLLRAVEGGLRLMVMHAVNNEALCALVDRIYDDCNDMLAADRQLQAAIDFRDRVDQDSGGPGQGWYQIVTTPQEARDAIAADKLAVVLGIEVDFLFNCRNEGDLTADEVHTQLDHYYNLGVRHLFPIHFADNGFGGTAYQNATEMAVGTLDKPVLPFINWVQTEDGTAFGYKDRGGLRNVRGLTDIGKVLIREMIARHMIIDVDHMSSRSRADTFAICEEFNYPVVSGHTGFIEINKGDKCHEGQLTADEVRRVVALGGMVSVIPCQGKLAEVDTWRGPGQTVVEHVSGNTSNTTVQAYLYAVSKSDGGPVALGTDFNGFAGLPGPRFGPEAAPGGSSAPAEHEVVYDPDGFTVAATGKQMPKSVVGAKTFDINVDGLAHVGMLPDFIADWQAQGLTEKDLAPLLRSASGYVDVWTSTYAQPSLKDPRVFDADFYLRHNLDVAKAFGGDALAARNHWLSTGLPKEGRRGSAQFDVQFYLSFHPDLKTAYGMRYGDAVEHWVSTGLPKEGRRASIDFDVKTYLLLNPDVHRFVGTDYGQAATHWRTTGLKEGRRATAEFDPPFYLDHYVDLKDAFTGPDYVGAFRHWLTQGLPKEGRRGSPEFDVQYYLKHNPDLTRGRTMTYEQALYHWVTGGLPREGRAASGEFDVTYYVEHNPDVHQAVGSNHSSALVHWFTTGLPTEGRRASAEFDVKWYIDHNPDVKSVVHSNYRSGLLHWINAGKAEGRKGAP
jgi:microsomal dipeptidase-like Zn-dependent dipeptidase